MKNTIQNQNVVYKPYWEIVERAEWAWLVVVCLFIGLTGDVPLFSVTMTTFMAMVFKVVASACEATGIRQRAAGVVFTEVGVLFVTCISTQLLKEFAIATKGVNQFFFEHYTGEFRKAIDAGAIENGSKAIEQTTDHVTLILDALHEAFISPPFLTGSSVVLFTILTYAVTRGVSWVWWGHVNSTSKN